MKILAICIPNYNRIDKLEKLVFEASKQIISNDLREYVQICISDDFSWVNPKRLIEKLKVENPGVEIKFERNTKNEGMDYNFLHSVMMAESEYCWIVGNDDLISEDGIKKTLEILQKWKGIDILLTPFDIYEEDEKIRGIIYPLKERKERLFNTAVQSQYKELLLQVEHNSGIFGFLSNVVFKRSKWVEYKTLFMNKMDTLFIQMYMNIQSLNDGAYLLYSPEKIIKNYADDDTNNTIKRICKILFGLDGVVEYFFEGEEKLHLKRKLVDAYINGVVWNLQEDTLYKKKVRAINSPKNRIYAKYFIPFEKRAVFFAEKKLLIYGAGDYGKKVYKELKKYGAKIIGIADSDESKQGMKFEEFKILSFKEMIELYEEQNGYILVSNHFSLEIMVNVLLNNDVERIGIIC